MRCCSAGDIDRIKAMRRLAIHARELRRCAVRLRGNEIREDASLKRAARLDLQPLMNNRNAHLQQRNRGR
jgi:hypothetical protein